MATAPKTTTAADAPGPYEPPPADTKSDPVGKPVEPEKAKTIDDHGIKATDPYPTGSPPAPSYAEINGLTPPPAAPTTPAPVPAKGG